MIDDIIKKLKESVEGIDKRIPSAHQAMRSRECDRLKKARMLIQEAITELLEVS